MMASSLRFIQVYKFVRPLAVVEQCELQPVLNINNTAAPRQASRREGGRSEIQMLLMPALLCHKDINVCMRPRDSPWPGSCRASVWSTAQLCSSVLTGSDCQTVMVIPPPKYLNKFLTINDFDLVTIVISTGYFINFPK